MVATSDVALRKPSGGESTDPEDWVPLAWQVAGRIASLFRLNPRVLVGAAMSGISRASQLYDPRRSHFAHYARMWARAEAVAAARREAFFNTQRKRKLYVMQAERLGQGDETDEPFLDGCPDESIWLPDEAASELEIYRRVRAHLEEIDARDRSIIERNFFGGESLEEIGVSMNLSRERVRQLRNRGLRRVRALYDAQEEQGI